MEKGLVSVIMPSWNTADYIRESICSVLNQTYDHLELIIVDDCSSDNTLEVVSKFKDNRIHFFSNEENLGAAMTRNKALQHAKGEWIAFLDSDDLWQPDKLEKQVGFMNKYGIKFSYHNYEKIDESGESLGIMVTGPNVVTQKKMYHYGYPGCLTFMYSSEHFGLIQIDDIKKNNDYAILLKLCKIENCHLLPENLAKYRIRRSSISHDKFLKKLRSHFDLFYKCDKQPFSKSFFYSIRNMYYGLEKKILYETRGVEDE